MRILRVHTYYQWRGGEDNTAEAEAVLLREKNHVVELVRFDNRHLESYPYWKRAALTFWNPEAYRKMREVARAFRPHVVHIHNTFPVASPAVIHAAKAEGVPLVVTLHNYRLFCVNALFFREGQVCEACLGKLPWRGALHGCYRNSRPASAVVAGMLGLHQALGTWGLVDRFIALTEFARQKFINGGLPAEKIMLKPHFVAPDPGVGLHDGDYALFVGRLSPEKGIRTLLAAWRLLGSRVPLRVVGDGPLRELVIRAAAENRAVEWVGSLPVDGVLELMGRARLLVFPSEWYETFGRVVVEAFARGTPVVAADLGAAAELVREGETGFLFRPGDPEDLAAKIETALADPGRLRAIGRAARAEFEAKYTAEPNYRRLMEIYEVAIRRAAEGR